jgi:hypothetical protein
LPFSTMKLVWHPTGDEIELVPVNRDLLEYYVQQINTLGKNSFILGDSTINHDWPTQLRHLLSLVSPVLVKAGQSQFEKFVDADFNEQHNLNELHREYVLLGRQFNVRQYLHMMKLEPSIMEQINTLIHNIEEMYHQEWNNDAWLPNPFSSSLINFETHNVYLEYQDFGRHQWECFLFGVDNWDDLSNFANLGSNLNILLHKPMGWQPPPEYLDWCQQRNLPPIGNRLNLADIKDLDQNLGRIRKLFARNTEYTMSIEI